jgi:hypothetical protein
MPLSLCIRIFHDDVPLVLHLQQTGHLAGSYWPFRPMLGGQSLVVVSAMVLKVSALQPCALKVAGVAPAFPWVGGMP